MRHWQTEPPKPKTWDNNHKVQTVKKITPGAFKLPGISYVCTKKHIKFVQFDIDIFPKIEYNVNAGRNTLYTRVTELTFKRYIISSGTRLPLWRFFIKE